MNEARFEIHLASALERRLFPGPLASQVETQIEIELSDGTRFSCSISDEPTSRDLLYRGGAGVQAMMDIAGHVAKQMLKHYSDVRMDNLLKLHS